MLPHFAIILILAVVQGVTEFLPISSSGHLVILADLLAGGETERLEIADVNIVLHVGTLLSILVFYWTRVWRLLGEDRRTIGLLVIGTIPAVVVGVPLKVWGDALLESPLVAGCLLPVTGAILIVAARGSRGEGTYQELSWARAFWIGCSQAVAILPGLSRSGTTISAGMKLGLAPQSAATFSFLLALPAIAGAGLLGAGKDLLESGELTTPLPYLAAGMAVSFLVGLASLGWLVRWIERGKLHYFAYWCIPLGAAVIAMQLAG